MFTGLSSLREKDEKQNEMNLKEIRLRNKYLEKYKDNKKKKKNHDKKYFQTTNVKLVDTEVNILTTTTNSFNRDNDNDEGKLICQLFNYI